MKSPLFAGVMLMVAWGEAAAVPPSMVEAPTGTYHGTKSVLGVSVDITVLIESTSSVDIKITGPLSVDCDHETYKYDGASTITLPTKDTPGDCVHDALAKAPGGASLKSLVYDQTADQVTVTAKVSFFSLSVVLTKSGSMLVQAAGAQEHNGWFKEFVHAFSKSYTDAEQPARLQVFKQNLAKIEAINLDGTLGHHWPNRHSDLTPEEFGALQFKA